MKKVFNSVVFILFGMLDICVLFGLGYLMTTIKHTMNIPMLLIYILGCVGIYYCSVRLLVYLYLKIRLV
jgi:hypothetical protein